MIQINNLTFTLPHKTCFEGFNALLHPAARIALIGQNGSGKSSLIKMLAGQMHPSEGHILYPEHMRIGYVPQLIDDHSTLSGGERFQKALTEALAQKPDLLLLDEPSNHLDRDNRKSLMRMLQRFRGILIVATHDTELIRNCIDTLWHFDQGQITMFNGSYDDYLHERQIKRTQIEDELSKLSREKKYTHQTLMKEQERAKKSDARGVKSIANRKWPTIVSDEKARRAVETSGKKKRKLRDQREELKEKLSETRLPEIITPTFSIDAADISEGVLVSIKDGGVGYSTHKQEFLNQVEEDVLSTVNLSISSSARIALHGKNGSGKSTLVKAILDDPTIIRSGEWYTPKPRDIGYLDQHYANVEQNALTLLSSACPEWSHAEVRKHLNDFLFRKNEEVNASYSTLSGGEKARLSLALIAAKTPKLLILDEITNNIDLETREHVIQVLKNYPGALVVISHDQDFLEAIGVEEEFVVESKGLIPAKAVL